MKRILVILSFGFLLVFAGCSQAGTEETGSYAMIVIVNNKEYNGTEVKLDASKQQGEKISEVIKETKASEMPQGNNQSNHFPVGSIIYSVKGTDNYIIVKDKKNKRWLLEKVLDRE
ncbi:MULTISPECIES: hypothetical protein [Exiguobacterium]|jgi:hypothetical protein|uniref:hypothetical protein n=1 Tax=Exiguobacterium TaxID=33986 RepID=UPI001BE84D8A|nr:MULTISPECIES: hypothetical protein [Exiguobacterium]MCT4793578.1 hypothetical protein [Exiguobacterium artemiae]